MRHLGLELETAAKPVQGIQEGKRKINISIFTLTTSIRSEVITHTMKGVKLAQAVNYGRRTIFPSSKYFFRLQINNRIIKTSSSEVQSGLYSIHQQCNTPGQGHATEHPLHAWLPGQMATSALSVNPDFSTYECLGHTVIHPSINTLIHKKLTHAGIVVHYPV